MSTDSDGPSLPSSQIGSLDELGTLVAPVSPTAAGGGVGSPRLPRSVTANVRGIGRGMLGKTVNMPLSPSRGGLPRPKSHDGSLNAFGDVVEGSGGGGVCSTSSSSSISKVNVLRPIDVAPSVPTGSTGTLS